MELLTKTGRWFYAIAIAAIGFQQFFYGDFHPMLLPPLHAGIPCIAILAYLGGAALIAVGAAIVFDKMARPASLILGGVLLALFLLYYIPYELIVDPYYRHLGVWGAAEKELALAGGAFVIAGSFPAQNGSQQKNWLVSFLEKLIPFGPLFFCITMISFGLDHFFYTEGVSTLVPNWIPGHMFWTYFAGVALIGSGLAIVTKIGAKPAAMLLGLMVLLWFIFLHIPRAIDQPLADKGNEVASAFSALAFSGIAFVVAGGAKKVA